MMRRLSLVLAGLVLAAGSAAAEPRKPNVIVIVADDRDYCHCAVTHGERGFGGIR